MENVKNIADNYINLVKNRISGLEKQMNVTKQGEDYYTATQLKIDELTELLGEMQGLEISEDDGGGMVTLDAVPGMGAPTYASRDADGSGDVPTGTKKRKKRISLFDEYFSQK
jgi:hypothetical protein